MKKGIALLLALLLAFSLLGCGSSNAAEENNAENNNTAETETQSVAEPVDNEAPTVVAETTISNNSPYDEGEETAADFSELLGSANGIELYGKSNYTFDTPADGMFELIFLIKNTNDYEVQLIQDSSSDVNSDNFSGSITEACRDFTTITHPNGSDYLIEANGELTMIYDISLPNFNNQAESLDGDLIFSYDYRFSFGNEVATIPVTINAAIHYDGRDTRNDSSNLNAVIKGVVVDSASNPVQGVEIEAYNAYNENLETVMTNEQGEFELQVTAHKSNVSQMWHECLVTFKHPSYGEKTVCVYPKADQTNELQVVLPPLAENLNYTITSTLDLGIQAYSYDTDVNKTVMAFTPFHSGLDYNTIQEKVNLTVTDYDGNLLFQYPLNAEAPWVCVSDDGQYFVTEQAIDGGNESSTYVVILNANGETVYTATMEKEVDTPQGMQKEIIHSRCAQLSHNNQYLIVGSDDGDFWVIDWQTDTLLWSFQTHGQVRNIVFNEDDSRIYISSGDGFMYGFDAEGNQQFKTYVGSWATDMELADNKLVYTLKTAWNSLGCIDVTTGDMTWTYQTLARGSGLAVSKDHKYVWWGNDVSSAYSCLNNAVFDLETGEIAYVLNHDAGQEAMYSDDGKYLVVKTSTKLEIFETENYTCVYQKEVIDPNGENAASINQTVAVNADASKIIAAFNNDPSSRFYGQAYYFTLG